MLTRVLPWRRHAIKLGLLIAMTSFVWINLSYLITLPIDTISQSQTVAVDFARVILGDIGAKVVTVGVALSAFSTCHGSLLAGAQVGVVSTCDCVIVWYKLCAYCIV